MPVLSWISVFSVNSSVYLVPFHAVRFLDMFRGSWLVLAVEVCVLQCVLLQPSVLKGSYGVVGSVNLV